MKDIIEKAKRIKHLECIESELKEEIKKIQHLIKDADIEKTYLKDDVILYLESKGINKVKEGDVSIAMSDSPFSVVITNEDAVPPEYKKEVVTISIDKKALIADKPEIEGIDFIQSKRLTIKV